MTVMGTSNAKIGQKQDWAFDDSHTFVHTTVWVGRVIGGYTLIPMPNFCK